MWCEVVRASPDTDTEFAQTATRTIPPSRHRGPSNVSVEKKKSSFPVDKNKILASIKEGFFAPGELTDASTDKQTVSVKRGTEWFR